MKLLVSIYLQSNANGVFQQPHWCRMGDFWTLIARYFTDQEADSTDQLNKARDIQWNSLSTKKLMQLAKLT